jgi:hypothetical protein
MSKTIIPPPFFPVIEHKIGYGGGSGDSGGLFAILVGRGKY